MSELPNQNESTGDDLVFADEESNEQVDSGPKWHMEDHHCRR